MINFVGAVNVRTDFVSLMHDAEIFRLAGRMEEHIQSDAGGT